MPELEEYCEVRSQNGIFRNWTSVAVHYGADPRYIRTVQLECAEPMEPGRSGVALVAQRLKPGDRVNVSLGDQPVIEDGYIKIRQTAYDAERHAVQVVVVAKSNSIGEISVDVTKDSGQYRNTPFAAIANKVLQPAGVSLRLENPPAGADRPFRQVIVRTGETIGELVERLARQRGLWLWSDVDGTIVAGVPSSGSGSTLEEGVNIYRANSYIEFPWAESVVMRGQTTGSDDLWAKAAANITSQAQVPGGDAGKKVIGLAEHPDTKADLDVRAQFEAQSIAAATHRDMITHKGWYRPGTSELWKIGDSCVVKSPMLYPFDGGQQTLLVWGVTCSQNDKDGTTTSVELVNKATWAQRFPDGKE